MSNIHAGQVDLPAGSKTLRLAMTLGAMAEIEEAFELDSIADLGTKLQKPKIKDLLVILSALTQGGGEKVSVEELKQLPIHIKDAKDAIEKVLQAANDEAADDKKADAPADEGR